MRKRPWLYAVIPIGSCWAFVLFLWAWDAELRWWFAPPSCDEAAADLALKVDLTVERRWMQVDSSHQVVRMVQHAGRSVNAGSRRSLAEWGRVAADVVPPANASDADRRAFDDLVQAGRDVIRACE